MLAFDRFQVLQTKPVIRLSQYDKWKLISMHPQLYRQLKQMPASQAPGEGLPETLHMYAKVHQALDPLSRKQLKNLLKQGVLQNNRSDDNHSTLYHLYSMLVTRRAQGYDNRILLKETVDILGQPGIISQKFAPLSENATRQILLARNYPGLNRANVDPPAKPLTPADLNVDSSATCVSSSLMYYMAEKEPAELARHLSELTSPMNAFLEKVRLAEISPDNPQEALTLLRENRIPFSESGPGEVTVKVENPPAGMYRAIDAQRYPAGHQYRSAVEAAYQSALTHLATRSYDPATDFRDSDAPGETSKGLTEAEKTMMETIVKENGGVQSVTYQAVANKANPAPGEEGNSYLYGYNRSFEQTITDILKSLRMNEPVIIGTTDTDETGAIVTGHEITVSGAGIDPSDNQLKFIVADSDDGVPSLVVKSAKELIPTIHHAGLPTQLARQVNREVSANSGYFIPDQKDAMNFKLLKREHGPMPVEQAEAIPEIEPNGQEPAPPPIYTPQAFPGNPLPAYTPAFTPGIAAAQPQTPFKIPQQPYGKPMLNVPTAPSPFNLNTVNAFRQPLPARVPQSAFQLPVYQVPVAAAG